jgi:hypothetical protein
VPSDAEVLFDGSDLDAWSTMEGQPVAWDLDDDGVLSIVPGKGNIYSKKAYGDVQLHLEWMIPEDDPGHGNSGIYLQSRYEVQIYKSYKNMDKIYYNGQAGSIYKQFAPLVNACRAPGMWETYDITFFGPKFNEEGTVIAPAKMTVFHNGILIHHNVWLKGSTTHLDQTGYELHSPKEPLMIQDHGDVVRFRNIWIREL